MITSTSTIFVDDGKSKTPVAVVGMQFNWLAMNKIYQNITSDVCF